MTSPATRQTSDRPAPKVSVAVSTYQRARLLPRLLVALESQTLPLDDFEVVVANNGATDETAEVLEAALRSSPLNLRVVSTMPNRGPAVGRNLAWKEARAPIVAFTDDDCVPTPEWLERGLAAIEGRAVALVGRTEPLPAERHLVSEPFSRTVRIDHALWFTTCNVFYRRQDLEAVDGFDPHFDSPGGEDTDLGLRICAQGAEAVFCGDAIVFHDVRLMGFRGVLKETLRWTGIPLVIKRHPHTRVTLLHRRYFWRRSHALVIPAMLGLALAPRRPAALALVAPWLRFRYRISPIVGRRRLRLKLMPAAFVIDALEVGVMIKASAQHRTLVL